MLNNKMKSIKLSSMPMMNMIMLFLILNFLNNFLWEKKMQILMMVMSMMSMVMYMNFSTFNKLIKENMIMGMSSMKKKDLNFNGFSMFIMSEIMIFASLFWSYIHNAYTPNMYMGNFWPPKGIQPANPTSMIIFGTSILLSSSLIIMVMHNNLMMKNNKIKALKYNLITLFMGFTFMDMQVLEMSNYMNKLEFNFNDSMFSSSFLMTTSLHATHVMMGIMALMISMMMMKKNINNQKMNMNLEMSIWYWHFVDYIWIVVFTLFYYLNH